MSKGLNQCIFAGRLGADAELRFMQSGTAKLSARLAIDESYKDKQGNEKGGTTWLNLVWWGDTAKNIEKYMKKGQGLTVVCRYHSYSYDDPEGNKKYAHEFIVDRFVFGPAPKGAGGASNGDEPSAEPNAGYGTQRRSGGQSSGGQRPQQRQADPPPAQEPAGDYDAGGYQGDDDIPF